MHHFKGLANDSLNIYKDRFRSLALNSHVDHYNKGDIIFKKEEEGDKFYFILQGSVALWVPKSESELNKEMQLNGEIIKYEE